MAHSLRSTTYMGRPCIEVTYGQVLDGQRGICDGMEGLEGVQAGEGKDEAQGLSMQVR
jgi:hypothetical protein